MRWWSWLWVGAIVWLTVGGAWDDHRDRRGALGIWLGVASGLVCVASVLAYSVEAVGTTLGRWLLPLSVLAGAQITTEAIRDVRVLTPDPMLTRRQNKAIEAFGVAAVILVFGVALVVWAATAVQRW